jgi:hypothetical protein
MKSRIRLRGADAESIPSQVQRVKAMSRGSGNCERLRIPEGPPSDARQLLVFGLQGIRGACVLAVIAIHVAGPARFSTRTPVDGFSVFLMLANSLARFAVPIFVLLSGFHLSLNVRNERPVPF